MKMFTTKEEIHEFFRVLQHEDISFHPDKKFEDYINNDTQKRRYNDAEVALRVNMLGNAFEYCKENNIDIYNFYRISCLQVDVEPKLREHFPILFELLEGQKLDWKSINTKFSETHLKRLTDFIRGNRELVESNFFDVLTEHWKGNKQGTRMLLYFRKLLEELSDNLDIDGKRKIKNTLYNLLIESDLNYLNYIGELSVLNLFLHKGVYRLHAIESPLGNGSGADFSLAPVNRGKNLLIEVVNVRPRTFPKTAELLKKFIEGKLQEKIDKKTKGDMAYLTFRLVPVTWGDAKELDWTARLLKNEISLDVPNITDPCAFCTFIDEERGGTIYKFGSLYDLFP
jgi:hypothetical protein